MLKTPAEILATVETIATETMAVHAATVDREGRFPTESLAALRAAGLLGLVSATEVGGLGGSIGTAAQVVERLARTCGSTAMVVCMHYCGTAVIEAHGGESTRRDIAAGRHLSTLAFSEVGSRSHFWAPVSTATLRDGDVLLNAHKSWITSARQATAYVWSSRPTTDAGAMSSLWLVPANAPGLRVTVPFDGIGLRGNDSSPVVAEGVKVHEGARLGPDGGGFGAMMGIVMPRFGLYNAACSVGLAESAASGAATHASTTRFDYAGSSLADLPTLRAYLARARVQTDMARALLRESVAAVEGARPDAMLRVLEAKAGCAEVALDVTALAMRVCGGAAFRKELGIDRAFRDAQAASVMGPTTDVLYDFIGKAVCNLPLFPEGVR